PGSGCPLRETPIAGVTPANLVTQASRTLHMYGVVAQSSTVLETIGFAIHTADLPNQFPILRLPYQFSEITVHSRTDFDVIEFEYCCDVPDCASIRPCLESVEATSDMADIEASLLVCVNPVVVQRPLIQGCCIQRW